MRYTLWCEHQQSQPEQTGFKFVIKGPQERMPRVFDNELETSPRCFRAHKLERTRIKKCNASGETVPCCAASITSFTPASLRLLSVKLRQSGSSALPLVFFRVFRVFRG
jgi:hypothetical protein